jgi:hypothetical protein
MSLRVRFLHPAPLGLAALAAVLLGCGGESSQTAKAAPGTPENPLVAEHDEAPGANASRRNEASAQPADQSEPDYQQLVARQKKDPDSRFSPCNLVSRSQARAIVGAALEVPVEAPQGPTCIYRSQDGDAFVTLSVQSADISELRRDMHVRQRVSVADLRGYCGTHGQPILYVPLAGERVLSVAAPCPRARAFATRAVSRLDG